MGSLQILWLLVAIVALVMGVHVKKEETVTCGQNTYYWGDYKDLHYCVDCPADRPHSQGCVECKIDKNAIRCTDQPPQEGAQSRLVDNIWHTPLSNHKQKAATWGGLVDEAFADPFVGKLFVEKTKPAVFKEFDTDTAPGEEVVIADAPPQLPDLQPEG
jgi:hypothetical protein